MIQLDLFAPPRSARPSEIPGAGWRSSDPPTSEEAALAAERSGSASAQREACLAEVRRTPGRTAAEIAARVGLERHAPSRRLPELREAGLVRNGEVRTCSEMGSKALTWWPA